MIRATLSLGSRGKARREMIDDFDYTPFVEKGGLGGARKVFGAELDGLIVELNGVLAV